MARHAPVKKEPARRHYPLPIDYAQYRGLAVAGGLRPHRFTSDNHANLLFHLERAGGLRPRQAAKVCGEIVDAASVYAWWNGLQREEVRQWREMLKGLDTRIKRAKPCRVLLQPSGKPKSRWTILAGEMISRAFHESSGFSLDDWLGGIDHFIQSLEDTRAYFALPRHAPPKMHRGWMEDRIAAVLEAVTSIGPEQEGVLGKVLQTTFSELDEGVSDLSAILARFDRNRTQA